MCFIRVDAEVTHFHLRFGPGQAQLAFKGTGIVILVSQHYRLFARAGDDRTEGTTYSLARRDSYAPAQTKHRIKHRDGRVRQRSIFHYRDPIGRWVTPAK